MLRLFFLDKIKAVQMLLLLKKISANVETTIEQEEVITDDFDIAKTVSL